MKKSGKVDKKSPTPSAKEPMTLKEKEKAFEAKAKDNHDGPGVPMGSAPGLPKELPGHPGGDGKTEAPWPTVMVEKRSK